MYKTYDLSELHNLLSANPDDDIKYIFSLHGALDSFCSLPNEKKQFLFNAAVRQEKPVAAASMIPYVSGPCRDIAASLTEAARNSSSTAAYGETEEDAEFKRRTWAAIVIQAYHSSVEISPVTSESIVNSVIYNAEDTREAKLVAAIAAPHIRPAAIPAMHRLAEKRGWQELAETLQTVMPLSSLDIG